MQAVAAGFGLGLGLIRGVFLGAVNVGRVPFWPTVGLGMRVSAPWYVAAFVLGATVDYFTPVATSRAQLSEQQRYDLP